MTLLKEENRMLRKVNKTFIKHRKVKKIYVRTEDIFFVKYTFSLIE